MIVYTKIKSDEKKSKRWMVLQRTRFAENGETQKSLKMALELRTENF